MTLRRHRPWLFVALVLATATALVWSDVAAAQQSEPPTQLWEEYPLNPEDDARQPAGGGRPEEPDPRRDGAPAGGDAGGGTATDGERFPLLPIAVVLACLLLFLLLPGVSVWAHGRHSPGLALPERLRGRLNGWPVALGGFRSIPAAAPSRSVRLRDRIGAVGRPSLLDRLSPEAAVRRLRMGLSERRPSLLDRLSPEAAVRRLRMGLSEQGSGPRYPAAMPVRREKERELRPKPVPESSDPAGAGDKPAKPPKPKSQAPAPKKRVAQKPTPAKRPQPAKPPKPERAKPVPPAGRGASPVPKMPVSVPPPKHRPPARKEVRGEKEPSPGRPQLVDLDTLTEKKLKCSILWRRDGPVSHFYALSSGLQGHVFIVERSPEFEWLGGDVPAEAREAHAILVYALLRDGWRPLDSEGAWYRQRFERPVGEGGPESSER